jgi:hypothetical protein
VTCGIVGFANNPFIFLSKNHDIFHTLGIKARRQSDCCQQATRHGTTAWERVGAGAGMAPSRRRALGHHQHRLSVPRDTLRHQTAVGACAEQTMSTRSTTTWRLQACAVKRLWRAWPRCQAWFALRRRWGAHWSSYSLLPPPSAAGAAWRLGFRLGFAAATGSCGSPELHGVLL